MSILDGIHPGLVDELPAYLFPSRAYLYPRVSADESTGQPSYTWPAATYSDVHCRKMSTVADRATGQEIRTEVFTREKQEWTLVLLGAYAGIDMTWRVTVDGVWYEIGGVDSDGNGVFTRLRIAEIRPLNPSL